MMRKSRNEDYDYEEDYEQDEEKEEDWPGLDSSP
jgi:hypothetical protein